MVERMSSEEYRALLEGKGKTANAAGAPSAVKRKNKFNAKKTVVEGITFDSAHEARRYSQLRLMERAGKISDLKLPSASVPARPRRAHAHRDRPTNAPDR